VRREFDLLPVEMRPNSVVSDPPNELTCIPREDNKHRSHTNAGPKVTGPEAQCRNAEIRHQHRTVSDKDSADRSEMGEISLAKPSVDSGTEKQAGGRCNTSWTASAKHYSRDVIARSVCLGDRRPADDLGHFEADHDCYPTPVPGGALRRRPRQDRGGERPAAGHSRSHLRRPPAGRIRIVQTDGVSRGARAACLRSVTFALLTASGQRLEMVHTADNALRSCTERQESGR
jgi:hypothetical protein